MTWVLTLDFPKPLSGLSLNDTRTNRHARHRSVQTVRQLMVIKASNARIPVMQRMQIELVWVVKDKRVRDPDNITPVLKAAADGLASNRGISAHLVPDDSPDYCTKLMPRIEYQPGATPHFEVIVTDLTHRPDDITGLIESRNL